MEQITPIGLDLAKHVFQVHGVDRTGKVSVRKQLRRAAVLGFFEAVPPCLVAWRLAVPRIIGPGN